MNYEILVNKDNMLDNTYIPDDLVECNSRYKNGIFINKKVLRMFNLMKDNAYIYGYDIEIMSGYRDYKYQEQIFNKLLNEKGYDYTIRSIAKPGCSEHQTGLAFDLNSVNDDFINTDEGKWINDNAYKYGFILRYPKGKEKYTGYKYESWHLRYVGVELAKKLYNNGDWIALEEYYDLKSEYNS